MLSLRILTAIVLIVPAVLSLFYLSPLWVAAFFGIFMAGGAWEWTALIGMRSVAARIGYVFALVGVGAILLGAGAQVATITFAVAMLAWTLFLVELVRHPETSSGWLHRTPVRYFVGFFVLVPAWLALYTLHALDPRSPAVLLFALALVWVADSVAYFAGHMFGRRKLAPAISPGKTWEGVAGGLLGVALLAWLGSVFIWRYGGADLGWWLAVAIVAALYSVLGDLLESKYKRAAGVKDSGKLLPGHGGVLDRIDATTAALPVFALGWQLLFAGTGFSS